MMRGVLFCLFAAAMTLQAQAGSASVEWYRSAGNILRQKPQWYSSVEAIRIADNALLYQRNAGGWPANIDMTRKLTEEEKKGALNAKSKQDCTLDNGATHTHLCYLAGVYDATRLERFKKAFYTGLDYLLKAQYPNGGWPQTYPWLRGYHTFITFNDGAMIGAMIVLRDIAQKKPPYTFVDEDHREKANMAVQKGIDCILKCQIVVDGKLTAWCQQHNEQTLEPGPARSFEPVAITGCESVDIVRFLMDIDRPGPEVIEAIESAVLWFDIVKLTGIRQIDKPDPSAENGYDKVIIEDANAPPLWARFYQIKTNRPLFCGKDGIIKYSLAEIEHERRTGYAWYGDWPARLLSKDYPAWQKKWAPGKNVLNTKPSEKHLTR